MNYGFNYGGVSRSQDFSLPVGANGVTGVDTSTPNFGTSGGFNPNQFTQGAVTENAPNIMGGGFSNGINVDNRNQNQIDLTRPLSGVEKFGIGAQGVNSLLQGFLGLKQYGLANKQYKASRDASERNFNNQESTYNEQLADRQRSRGHTEDNVSAYMSRYGLGK